MIPATILVPHFIDSDDISVITPKWCVGDEGSGFENAAQYPPSSRLPPGKEAGRKNVRL